MWRDEKVAVKTFASWDHESWQNEFNIFNTISLRHEYILGFIAADTLDKGTHMESWLITEYHEHGSLFDFLARHTLTLAQTLVMLSSVVGGLSHLHMPIEGCVRKPRMAHCDLKSRNILVKINLTCCLSDFGLSLIADSEGKVTRASHSQIRFGTKRYQAPEMLLKTICCDDMDAFQKADMYALGLVMWELMNRCQLEGDGVDAYVEPYHEFYNEETLDEARLIQAVCVDKMRPRLKSEWKENAILGELIELTEELWTDAPNERLNSLRIKKSLNKIRLNVK